MPEPSIIAATDLSARSAHVAGRAARLAERLGARLIVAHVTGGDTRSKPDEDLRLLSGEAGAAIAALARDEHAQVIVLGLHRERRVLDLLRLTTMERIVLAAPCPVLIAHQPPEEAYAQVLGLTDFSAASAAALAMAARIAPDAAFHAIHALRMRLGARAARGNREYEAAMQRAEAARESFLALPGLPAFTEKPEIVPGGVHPVLAFRREELGADLVCVGAHSGRDPRALGNYARDLMRAPPTDLLIAKPA